MNGRGIENYANGDSYEVNHMCLVSTLSVSYIMATMYNSLSMFTQGAFRKGKAHDKRCSAKHNSLFFVDCVLYVYICDDRSPGRGKYTYNDGAQFVGVFLDGYVDASHMGEKFNPNPNWDFLFFSG